MPFNRQIYAQIDTHVSEVSRYLTFEKLVSLLERNAMWFSILSYLQDKFEGKLPKPSFEALHCSHMTMKSSFMDHPAHNQFDNMAARNIEDGRVLTAVNCWHQGHEESERMWNEYVPDGKGVLILSRIERLDAAFSVHQEYSSIGKVQYVDFETHPILIQPATDSHRRAFLKDKKSFEHENEIRLVTLNAISSGCLNDDGNSPTAEQQRGIDPRYQFRKGFFVRCDLMRLIEKIVVSPSGDRAFKNLIRLLVKRYALPLEVQDSSMDLGA